MNEIPGVTLKLLERLFPPRGSRKGDARRRTRHVDPNIDLSNFWQFHTTREDIPIAYISADCTEAYGIFVDADKKRTLRRLNRRQFQKLLAHEQSDYFRPKRGSQ